MSNSLFDINKEDVFNAYSHIGTIKSYIPYGNGHINDTFLAHTENEIYIIQRINHNVFTKPEQVMKNISAVCGHIKEKSISQGKDPERSTMSVIKTNTGDNLFKDKNGNYWRMYSCIPNSISKDKAESLDDFRECGKMFGEFQGLLADFPAHKLYETISDFHNTPKRFDNFIKAVKEDKCGRVTLVQNEINFVKSSENFSNTLEEARENGELPIRVTHNDTKLNNILFDSIDGSALCVVDLDTVMPGYSVTDFGDSIRFGANTADEDETDISKVALNLDLFRAYTEGFIKGCNGKLTEKEIDLLPTGAMMMTYECGMRFLTDYIEGDVYFKTKYETHNLDRCRNQFALLSDMENKLDQMNEIIDNVIKQIKENNN